MSYIGKIVKVRSFEEIMNTHPSTAWNQFFFDELKGKKYKVLDEKSGSRNKIIQLKIEFTYYGVYCCDFLDTRIFKICNFIRIPDKYYEI